MKIGIITLLGNNYGNRLQNYAVQKILEDYGDVFTVPYEKKNSAGSTAKRLGKLNPAYIINAVNSRLLNIYHISNRKMSIFGRVMYFLRHRSGIKKGLADRDAEFKQFDKKYIKYAEKKLHLSGDDNEKWVLDFDAWVCGSDQIWNPTYPTATRNAFLQFAEKNRRIALSASIGISGAENMPGEYKDWINEIPYLSVREDDAADIVKDLTGREAKVFLDPTMLVERENWDDIAGSVESDLPDKFAFCYFLGVKEREYQKFIDNYVKSNDLEKVEVLNGQAVKYLSFGPDRMINAIKNAGIVFTDSFHGVVFSILFHKKFVVFERSEEGLTMNSRLVTLMKKFNFGDRVFCKENIHKLDDDLDFTNSDAIINEERKKLKEFLDKAFSEIKALPKKQIATNSRVDITRKEKCYGCSACASVCPTKCITLTADDEGFLYPEIKNELCINCGKCSGVCPYNSVKTNTVKNIYAAINNNCDIRKKSSSGGVFYELAKSVINDDGVVFGCAWNGDMKAVHIMVDDITGIERLRGSKYVQSNLGSSFTDTEKILKSGKKVLFSGTPCQVAGLKNFLGKDYPNLLTVDVLCHGTPSPKVFEEYKNLVEEKFGSKIVDINLRDKSKSWHRLHTKIDFENGKNFYTFCGYDTYMSMFLTNMSQRPSCFECRFTTDARQGDITLGDFWGVGKHIFEMDDDKGTSMVAINTENGNEFWNKIKMNFKVVETDFSAAESGNKVLSEPPKKNQNRDNFYRDFALLGYEAASKKWINIPSKPKQIYYDFMRVCLDFYRLILRKKY